MENKPVVQVWTLTSQELNAILDNFVGNFEKELNKHKDNIPNTENGKHRAVKDGLLPDCGMYWLQDRGVTAWYIENGWLAIQEGKGKVKWILTQAYVDDKIPQMEEALNELINRRQYKKEKNE